MERIKWIGSVYIRRMSVFVMRRLVESSRAYKKAPADPFHPDYLDANYQNDAGESRWSAAAVRRAELSPIALTRRKLRHRHVDDGIYPISGVGDNDLTG